MSDTPIVDANVTGNSDPSPDEYEELAATARMLERQLAAERERADRAEADFDRIENVLHRIQQWCRAYPLDVFPEPDFVKAKALLERGGITLDAVSASNMRHVVNQISQMIPDKAMKDA